jgi:hypothetical protein
MNGICEIQLGETTLKLKFGMPAMQMIFEDLEQLAFLKSTTYQLVSIVGVVWAGYLNECILERKVPALKYEELFELIEDNASSPDLEKAMLAFNDSKMVKKLADMPEEEKKRSTGKKSK